VELPIAWNYYESRSKAFSAQRLLNFYTEMGNQGTKSNLVLFQRPALTTFTTVGTGPIRGVHTVKGVPFIVSGVDVFTLASDGTSTNLGTIGGSGRVLMDDNGDEVAIVSNNAGTNEGWIATLSALTQITDADFREPSSVTFQDSYFIWTEKDSAILFRSASFDGFSYDALDFATAEYAPDDLVRVFSDKSNLFAMGTGTIEPWNGTGLDGFSFDPIQGSAQEVGLLARDTVAKIDNSFLFFGSDERGGRTVWKLSQGYAPQRISTHPLEKKWDEIADPSEAYAFTFRIEGHAFYVLTFPSGGTWVYDASTNFWTEWQTDGRSDWLPIGFSSAFNKRLTGDSTSNKIYELDLNVLTDDGNNIIVEAVSAPVASERNELLTFNFFRVDLKAGVGLTSGQGSDPQILISWADEDGTNFGAVRTRSMGKIGETRKRVYVRRGGQARSRTYKIRISDPVEKIIIGGYVDVTGGTW